jgi:hypothetical protein
MPPKCENRKLSTRRHALGLYSTVVSYSNVTLPRLPYQKLVTEEMGASIEETPVKLGADRGARFEATLIKI